jgi:hypothetical protein
MLENKRLFLKTQNSKGFIKSNNAAIDRKL